MCPAIVCQMPCPGILYTEDGQRSVHFRRGTNRCFRGLLWRVEETKNVGLDAETLICSFVFFVNK